MRKSEGYAQDKAPIKAVMFAGADNPFAHQICVTDGTDGFRPASQNELMLIAAQNPEAGQQILDHFTNVISLLVSTATEIGHA